MRSSLSNADNRLLDFICQDPESFCDMTVSEVAAAAQVSEATLVRSARRFGFRGFADLKMALARDLASGLMVAIHEDVSNSDTPREAVQKVFRANINALEQTLALVDHGALAAIADHMVGARRVVVFGLGASAPIAHDAEVKLQRLGLNVVAYHDNHEQMVVAAHLCPSDVLLAISASGRSRDICAAMRLARSRGAKVYLITGFPRSPAAQEADITLLTSARETRFRVQALASRVAQVTLIDALYVLIALEDAEKSVHELDRLEVVLADKRLDEGERI